MVIKELIKRAPDAIQKSEMFVSFHCEQIRDKLWLNSTYFNRNEMERFISYFSDLNHKNFIRFDNEKRKHIRIPKIYSNKMQVSPEELEGLQRSIGVNGYGVDEFNKYLHLKVLLRDNAGYVIKEYFNLSNLKDFVKNNVSSDSNLHRVNLECSDKENIKLRLFNVGQANCSCLLNTDRSDNLGSPIAFFDLGSMKFNLSLIKTLDKFNNGYVFISHFDKDHINYGRHLFRSRHNGIKIICPTFDVDCLSISAIVFIASAIFSGCEIIQFNPELIDYSEHCPVNIYQGRYKVDANHNTEINAKSLICTINHRNNSVLIPGDALYHNFPICYRSTHLIIPHHGSKYYVNGLLPNINEQSVVKAFVYCGPSIRYRHADISHISHFLRERCTVDRFYRNSGNRKNSRIFNDKKFCNAKDDKTIKHHGEYIDWII